MINIDGAVNVHKKHVKDLIKGSAQEVTIRLPVDRVSSGVNPYFGDSSRETDDTGDTKGPYKCLWHHALSARSVGSPTGFETTVEVLAGQYRDATAFAEIWLEDVLTDEDDVMSPTWLDKAKDILYLDQKYDLLGESRLGLATAPPYILLVALKGSAGYNE
jgi:hypothetical protein